MFHCHGQTDRRVRVKYIRLLAECECFCSNLLCTRGQRISDGQPQYDTQTVRQSRIMKDSLGRADTCDRIIIIGRRACNRQMLLSSDPPGLSKPVEKRLGFWTEADTWSTPQMSRY